MGRERKCIRLTKFLSLRSEKSHQEDFWFNSTVECSGLFMCAVCMIKLDLMDHVWPSVISPTSPKQDIMKPLDVEYLWLWAVCNNIWWVAYLFTCVYLGVYSRLLSIILNSRDLVLYFNLIKHTMFYSLL